MGNTNGTFRPGALANTGGVDAVNGMQVTTELLTTDPALVAGVPRVWINITTGILKYTIDGATVKTVTAT